MMHIWCFNKTMDQSPRSGQFSTTDRSHVPNVSVIRRLHYIVINVIKAINVIIQIGIMNAIIVIVVINVMKVIFVITIRIQLEIEIVIIIIVEQW